MGWSEKYKKSIDCDNPKGFSQRAHCQGRKKKMSEEKKDHEYSMARSELKTVANAVKRLQKKMGKTGEGNLEAWVQSKITKAADYIDTAADYVTNEETDGIKAKNYKGRLDRWFDDGGWVQTGGKYDGKPCAQQPGQTTKPYCRDPDDRASMDTEERNKRAAKKRREDPNPNRSGKAKMVTQESAGEKDDCYKKVKSRYKVWPSAYASGALVKCRKVGAANWGNKSESYNFSNWKDDFKALEIETVNLIEPEPIKGGEPIDEKCWVGYKQVGMKKKGDKVVPNCVKEEELNEIHKQGHSPHEVPSGDIKKLVKKAVKRIDTDADGDVDNNDKAKGELGEFIPGVGNKRLYSMTRPKTAKESFSDWRTELDEDWQKVNKSDKTDGMSPAAVKAYRRENPGSKLKTAVTGDPKPGSKDAKRRKSFCSRSKGQQDMHNIDCSKDPDKAICKARRRWKC